MTITMTGQEMIGDNMIIFLQEDSVLMLFVENIVLALFAVLT